jgi:hypothetical protein
MNLLDFCYILNTTEQKYRFTSFYGFSRLF